jgi:carbamoyltransferase
MTWVLGLNAFHADASACLLRDGQMVCAVEQERLNRVKHWGGFPDQAIAWCLKEAGIGLGDLAAVALNRDGRAARWHKLAYVLRKRPSPALLLSKLRNRRRWASTEERLAAAFPGQGFHGRIVPVEHHLAHLASAYWASPFREASVVSLDGFGDFASAAWGHGSAGKLSVEGRVRFPHSLGILYEAATQYLGFPHYGDEYKVMGLAPYGEPTYRKALEQVLHLNDDGSYALNLDYFRHQSEDVAYQWRPDPAGGEGGMSGGRLWSPAWEALLGPARGRDAPLEQRHRDIARSVQAAFEDAAFNLIAKLKARHGSREIALAGGCAFNSVANGKLRRKLGFDRVYVQAAAGDAGGALGAALVAWQELSGAVPSGVMPHAYWGPRYDEDALAAAIEATRARWDGEGIVLQRLDDEDQLCRRVAAAIVGGAVVGWFQGRVEWGPRALGNRSILADPRRADMKDLLNRKIKRRESFRPFAPSVLAEAVGAWFEEDDAVPFMMQVFQIRAEKRALIPAVTHVDGSGRLQTVTRAGNPLYHRLIAAFAGLSGVPMLLNTSFNENEPIVCRPEEALDCFLRTRMDLLALGPFVLARGG